MTTIDYEFYETPDPFTRWLFAYFPALAQGNLFEPCCGDKAIVRASGHTRWMTNDIDPRWCGAPMDATQAEVWGRHRPIDSTITNPPFSLAVPILDHALRHSRIGVAMYLRLSIHEPLKTGDRRTFFAEHRPTAVLMLPRFAHQRSRTKGIWSADSMTSCWCVWLKGETRQVIDYAPESVIDQLEAFTPSYRERMDALMGFTGLEIDRQRQCVERWRG